MRGSQVRVLQAAPPGRSPRQIFPGRSRRSCASMDGFDRARAFDRGPVGDIRFGRAVLPKMDDGLAPSGEDIAAPAQQFATEIRAPTRPRESLVLPGAAAFGRFCLVRRSLAAAPVHAPAFRRTSDLRPPAGAAIRSRAGASARSRQFSFWPMTPRRVGCGRSGSKPAGILFSRFARAGETPALPGAKPIAPGKDRDRTAAAAQKRADRLSPPPNPSPSLPPAA